MSEDSFTEVTSEGWFSRIGNSIKGIVVGLILFAVAFPLIWWNEGRAVNTMKKINFAKENVVAVSASAVEKGNEGKLVQLSGRAETSETLVDSIFGISAKAIKLIRTVEMYQWKEDVESKSVKKLGGKKETVKTYNYSRKWSSNLTSSSSFKKQTFVNAQGVTISHKNPVQMKYVSNTLVSKNVKLGAFTMSDNLNKKISKTSSCIPNKVPAGFSGSIKLDNGSYFIGKDAANPAVGDYKVKFMTVDAQDVSVMARQAGNKLGAFQTPFGSYEQLVSGTIGVDGMISTAESSNSSLTWILRLVGLALMFSGLSMVFKPLSVIADVVPFIGDLVGIGTGIVAFLISLSCALVTVAVAWIFYRPILAIGLLAITGGLIFVFLKKRKAVKAQA